MLGVKNLFYFIKNIFPKISKKLVDVSIVIIIALFLSLNLAYIIDQFIDVDPFPYISGKTDRDDYITRFIPEYPALKYINSNLNSDDRIYFIFLGKRSYYCDRDFIFNINIMKDLIKKAEHPKYIFNGLLEQRITHLLVNYRFFERWMRDNFSEEKQDLTLKFFKSYTKTVYYHNGFGVRALLIDDKVISYLQ